jgi:membrane protein DedA with SNARE-associated domain
MNVSGLAGQIEDWAIGLMQLLGAPGAGLAIAIENLFPPLPSELILPLAGFAAANGTMTLVEAIVWTTTGSIVGALVLYTLGARLGLQPLRAAAERLPLLTVTDIDRASDWFARHGPRAVLLGRMVPIVRSLISIPAGVQRMHLMSFGLYTAVGSLVWNSAFILAGYHLGVRWEAVTFYASMYSRLALALIILGVLTLAGRRLLIAHRTRAAHSGEHDGH